MSTWRALFAAEVRRVRRFCVVLSFACVAGHAGAQDLGRGQQVLFAPSIASVSGANQWMMVIQGRVFESPAVSPRRQAVIDALAPVMGALRADPIYRERAGHFVSDSVGGVRVSVSIGGRVVTLPPTDTAGGFVLDVPLTHDEVARLSRDGAISFETLPTSENQEHFRGSAVLVPEDGLTVVTDMDDTIKETEVNDRAKAKANTFVLPFKPVAGMPELYQSWQVASGAQIHFHLVSAGPWQFHAPLRRFTEKARFPAFTWDMRSIDITDPRRLVEETISPDPQRLYDFKVAKIRALMARLPKRHVVLVGDSGERDPEVYATILSEFPDRVDAVFIRNVTVEGQRAPRYERLFPSAAVAAKLKVFTNASELPRRAVAQ